MISVIFSLHFCYIQCGKKQQLHYLKNCHYFMHFSEYKVFNHTAGMVYYPGAHHRSCFQWRVEGEDHSPEG